MLVLGFLAIKKGARERHRALMLGACASSALFLVGYLTRVAMTGVHRFPGGGLLKAFYLLVLGSHTLLAVACLPLVLRTLYLALRGRFPLHRQMAGVTLPISDLRLRHRGPRVSAPLPGGRRGTMKAEEPGPPPFLPGPSVDSPLPLW